MGHATHRASRIVPPAATLVVMVLALSAGAFEKADVYAGQDTLGGRPARWNHGASVVRLDDGTFVCAWSSGSAEGKTNNWIAVSRSCDGGRTWSVPVGAVDPPGDSLARDASIAWLAGRLRLIHVAQDTAGSGSETPNTSIQARTSPDTGRTWSAPRPIVTGRDRTYSCGRPLALPSGEWLIPYYWRNALGDPQAHASVLVTADSLDTWTSYGDLALPNGGWALEPAVAIRGDGSILMHVRTNVGTLYRSISTDLGRAWSAIESTGVPNSDRPGLVALPGGKGLLAAMPDALDRDFMSLWRSEDGGLTWPERLAVDRRAQGQVSYGSPVAWDDSVAIAWTSLEYPGGPGQPMRGTIRFARAALAELAPIDVAPAPGWTKRTLGGDPPPALLRVVFADDTTGWIAGGKLWKTTNRGATWDTVAIGAAPARCVDADAGGNVQVGRAGAPPIMSYDGGATWRTGGAGYAATTLGIRFLSPAIGWAVQSHMLSGYVVGTVDGGKTFVLGRHTENRGALLDVDVSAGKTVVAAGDFGTIVYSPMGGAFPIPLVIPGQMFAGVSVAGDSVAWLAGNGALYRTRDAGATWEAIPTPLDFPWRDVVAIDAEHAWAVGRDAVVATGDGGRTWSVDRLGAGRYLNGVALAGDAVVAIGAFGEVWTRQRPVSIAETPPQAGPRITAYPNPFNASATIGWSARAAGPAEVAIYDASGRIIRRRAVVAAQGWNRVIWDGRDESGRALGSGTYLFRVRDGERVAAGRLTLVR